MMAYFVSKEKFFMTETGRNIRDFYYEVIMERECDREGKDREQCVHDWMEGFNTIEVEIFPKEERLRFAFYSGANLVDEHYEDLYMENLTEIIADMESIIEGKPRHSWTPWSPEEAEA